MANTASHLIEPLRRVVPVSKKDSATYRFRWVVLPILPSACLIKGEVMNFRVVGSAAAGILTCNVAFAEDSTAPTPYDPNDIVLPQAPLFATPAPGPRNGGVGIVQSYDGIDFLGSNCGCLPPDTNAAVGNSYVVETVNVQIRVFDKTTGIELLDEPLATFFGAPSGGDVYVVYDDTVDRWYVSAFDSNDTGFFLAVSSDGNPTHPFTVYHLTNVGGSPDYHKPGFNLDAIFIAYNNFGPGGGAAVNIASIDKAAALSGTLRYFVSVPKFQFRGMPPAQIHDDKKGGVEWFVSTDGTDADGSTVRVTKMTNYLSNSPAFTYTSLPVNPYKNALHADQPGGGTITTFPNTTTYQVHSRGGRLITAMASATAADGFNYPKGLIYEINANATPPVLLTQAVIDPGFGVAVQMPSADEDKQGNLGLTWMESSKTEHLSMWVGALYNNGTLASQTAANGGGFFFFDSRIGDYSTVVLDADATTFWAANEYIGNNGAANIWQTHITSFTAKSPVQTATPLIQ